MTPLRIVLYGGEDYQIYDGTRLVATVYAERDLWRVNLHAIEKTRTHPVNEIQSGGLE